MPRRSTCGPIEPIGGIERGVGLEQSGLDVKALRQRDLHAATPGSIWKEAERTILNGDGGRIEADAIVLKGAIDVGLVEIGQRGHASSRYVDLAVEEILFDRQRSKPQILERLVARLKTDGVSGMVRGQRCALRNIH
jgi:hypothetical protein